VVYPLGPVRYFHYRTSAAVRKVGIATSMVFSKLIEAVYEEVKQKEPEGEFFEEAKN
jgi:hypothetical protein